MVMTHERKMDPTYLRISLRSWIPLESLSWSQLCANERVSVSLLQQRFEEIDWIELSRNNNPHVIPFLSQHLDKVHWPSLSMNQYAISI